MDVAQAAIARDTPDLVNLFIGRIRIELYQGEKDANSCLL